MLTLPNVQVLCIVTACKMQFGTKFHRISITNLVLIYSSAFILANGEARKIL